MPLAAQEVAVPIDSAGRLELIDRALERRLALFPDIPGFVEARLFQAPDGSFTLEITHRVNGRLARTRRTMTAAEADAFRNRVLAALAMGGSNALLDQRGRGELLRGAFALALGYNGWAVPVALDVEDSRTAIGLYTLTSAASFFLPLVLTEHAEVTEGQASLALWGGTRGIFHGIMAAQFFDETSSRAIAGWGLVGSLSEGIAGFAIAGRRQLTQGHADAMGMMGDIGGGLGLAVSYLLSDPNTDSDAAWAAGVLSSFAGVAVGDRLARLQPTTRGDVGVFRAATLLGSWTGFALMFAADNDPFDDVGKQEVGGAVAGTAVGFLAASLLTRNRDFTTAQGTIVSISALGGGLFGAGLGFLATNNSGGGDDVVMLASAAGAGLGFGIVYAALQAEARDATELSRVSFEVNPVALALGARSQTPLPLAGLSVRF